MCSLSMEMPLVYFANERSGIQETRYFVCARDGHKVGGGVEALVYVLQGQVCVRGKSHERVPAGSDHFLCFTDLSQSVASFPCVWK